MHKNNARRPLDKEFLDCKDRLAQRSLHQRRLDIDQRLADMQLERSLQEVWQT